MTDTYSSRAAEPGKPLDLETLATQIIFDLPPQPSTSAGQQHGEDWYHEAHARVLAVLKQVEGTSCVSSE